MLAANNFGGYSVRIVEVMVTKSDFSYARADAVKNLGVDMTMSCMLFKCVLAVGLYAAASALTGIPLESSYAPEYTASTGALSLARRDVSGVAAGAYAVFSGGCLNTGSSSHTQYICDEASDVIDVVDASGTVVKTFK